MTVKSTDVWTEQIPNDQGCFDGAFIDGVENRLVPYDRYKIVLNCNCIIKTNREDIVIGNKHHAIVFYKGKTVVRLLVACCETNVVCLVDKALNQIVTGRENLRELLNMRNIQHEVVNLGQQPVFNKSNGETETNIGSCDRDSLLNCMLQGSYTESETGIGDFECVEFEYVDDVQVLYELDTGEEKFNIDHKGSFLNKAKTRAIIIQTNGTVHLENFLTDERTID